LLQLPFRGEAHSGARRYNGVFRRKTASD
jgi:hypothetical protein